MRIILLLLSFVFFIGAVTFYINRVTIPKDLKKIILKESRQFLGRPVHLKDLSFNPITGFTLEGITILEKDSTEIFTSVDRVRVHLLYWPLLRQQKVIISSLELKGISLNLIHYSPGEWNFSDLLRRRSEKTQQPRKIYLSRLIVKDGYVHLTNLQDGLQFSEVFDPVDATVNLSVTKGIVFEAAAHYADKQRTLEITGNAQPLKEQFNANIRSNGIAVKAYLDLFQPDLPFIYDDLSINTMDVELSMRRHTIDISGTMTLGAIALRTQRSQLLVKSLALHDLSFGFHDGEYILKGQIMADAPKFVLDERSYAADLLTARLNDTTLRAAALNMAGSLSATRAAITAGEKWNFMGDVQLNSLNVSRGANALSATAAADIKNASLSVGTKIRMNGDFLSPGLTVINASDTTTVKGDLYANNLFYSWPMEKELRGQAALTNIRVVGNPQTQWTARSDVQFNGIRLKLPGGNSLTSDAAGPLALEYTPENKKFKITSTYQLTNGTFAMSNGMTLTGSPSGTVSVSSKKENSPNLPYYGSMEFKDAVLVTNRVGAVENIHGTVSFENNRARTSDLNLRLLGMPALLTGTLEDFSSPSLDITVYMKDFDLTKTQEIIPEVIKTNALTLAGTAPWLSVSYQGLASTTNNAAIAFEAQVADAVITSGQIEQTATGVTGGIRYEDKKLFWQDLNAQHNGKNYRLTGSMVPSAEPTIETEIEADRFKVKTRFQHTREKTVFEQLIGHYKNAVFNLTGSTQLMPGGGRMFDVTGEADLELKDLPLMFPNIPDGIKKCGLGGMTHVKGSFKGDPSHWQDWQFDLTGASPQFTIWGMNIHNMKFNAVQKNNLLKPLHVWGEFYDGDLNVVASLDTAKKELPFEIIARVLNSDLNKLRIDTPFKKQSLAGTLSTTAILSGQLADLKVINGKGGVEIKDGMLWELDLLKGLGGLLLIPEYKDIIFTQAGMNFTMADGVMSTENIQLLGPSLNLFGKGTLDLKGDQALNLLLSPDFNTSVVVGSSSLKKGTTAIITGTEKFMSVEVTGTVSKPNYKVNNAPVKILQKTGGVILENVSQFFQNIF